MTYPKIQDPNSKHQSLAMSRRQFGTYWGLDIFWFLVFGSWGLVIESWCFSAPLPQPIAGWRMELIAEAPQVNHPTVVCVAPDGRVFVAEDPMDIRTPRADAMEGRILCIHPGGRITVFAEKLYAIFGLQYLEGKLYVLHNPKFSVFTDDGGVGRDRVDLIEQTNPKPWALDWNDHVPANFRLGMDGYFYVAVGDKGLFGAVGRDGSRVDLHGGGIMRLRPDGTNLEIFSRGVRNIMDVAMNAEDELFTYDNTDEHDWMGRLTHMVDRGFYGYPHDFIPRRPYTLWMMHDFGGGAATGIECYTEDALPAEYHGNLFLADFGKRQVLRVQTERHGATYRVVKHQEMFPNPPEDFRPVGIAWSEDGLGLYICDWAHRDTKEDVKVGRLWKATWTGTNQAAPKPDWYLPLALGQDTNRVPNVELAVGLSHPARSVRMTAQRALVKAMTRNPNPLAMRKDLARMLSNSSLPAAMRWHVLWTLKALDEGTSGRRMILAAAAGDDPGMIRQALRALGTSPSRDAVKPLMRQLQHPDASVRFHAATALGRVADTRAIPALITALDESDSFTRYAVFTALNHLGCSHPESWPSIVKGLNHSKPRVREGAAFALRGTYDLKLAQALAARATSSGDAVERAAVLRLLAPIHRKPPPWNGEWWAYHPALAPPPKRSIEWAGTSLVFNSLLSGISDAEPMVRLSAVEGLEEAGNSEATPVLLARFARESEAEVRRSILRSLTALKDPRSAPLVATLITNPPKDTETVHEALRAAAALGGTQCIESLIHLAQSAHPARARAIATLGHLRARQGVPILMTLLTDEAAAVRLAAIVALGEMRDATALPALRALAKSPSAEERNALARALGNLPTEEAVPLLIEFWQDKETKTTALEALTKVSDPRAIDAYLGGLASMNPTVREQCRKALGGIREEALPVLETRAPELPPGVIAELREVYRRHEAASKGPIFATQTRALTPEDYQRHALEQTGDAVRGQRIFWDEAGVACIRCHTVAGHGVTLGPDLTTIGAQFPRRELIDHILYPSRAVREGYQQVTVETKDGEVHSGLIRSETAGALTLADASGKLHTVAKTDITSRSTSQLSLMPEGLHVGLTLDQFADLFAYLESRKSDPRKPANIPPRQGFENLLPLNGEPVGWRELPAGTQRVDAKAIVRGRAPEHWMVKDGVLEHDGLTGDLWTTREFGDFHLHLEWRWVDAPRWADFTLINADGLEAGPDGHAATLRVLNAGDSGVLLRGSYKAQANLFCYPVGSGEFWEYRTDPNSTREQRRSFTPKQCADRAVGDWNEMQIQLSGERITILLNGVEVISNAELPGVPDRGPIGLQHEHGRIQFRNMFIREQPSTQ